MILIIILIIAKQPMFSIGRHINILSATINTNTWIQTRLVMLRYVCFTTAIHTLVPMVLVIKFHFALHISIMSYKSQSYSRCSALLTQIRNIAHSFMFLYK